MLKEANDWDRKMEEYSVYRWDAEGRCVFGKNGARLAEYEACRVELIIGRMRIGRSGDVIPFDTDPKKLVLPAQNLQFTPEGAEGRRTYLFGISEEARAARLRVIELLGQMGAELSECEKLDKDDLSIIKKISDKSNGPLGPVYDLERDKNGRHGSIMKYNLNQA